MTTREALASQGFHFFCFTKPEARAEFKDRNTETFEFAEVDEKFLAKEFEVFFLGVKRLEHTPVTFTKPTEAL